MGGPQQQCSTAGNIRILARVRPQLAHEYQFDQAVEVPSATQIKLQNTKQSYDSSYDRVLPDSSSQEQVYAQVSGCIPSLLQGYNNTIFSYGQTGTGKTYTMIGDPSMTLAEACSVPSSTSRHGILSRAVHDLFAELDQRKAAAASRGQEYDVKLVCSYLEIYNDRLYDLLQPYKKASSRDQLRIQLGKTSLEVREDPVAGTHIPSLLYVDVKSCKQVLQLVATGNSNRATAHTDMNRHSSRSHAILQLWLEQRPSSQDSQPAGVVVRSKMNFVDLAGSERWGKAHTEAEGRTLINELTSINNSLSALAIVVSALTDKAAKHIPYRSSRLTHLLQDSLGGNCYTTLIVTVAPCVDAFDDSMAALKFADRARNIANKAVVNSMHDTDTILAVKEREIQRLRALLASYTGVSAAGGSPISVVQHPSQWSSAGFDQDGLLLPSSHPTTPSSLQSSTSTDSRRQLSHLSASVAGDAHITSQDNSTAGEDSAGAADRTRLESELASMRAALELERNMRSALEGQLQVATAAAQAQQQAAAAAAVAAMQAQQQAVRAQPQQHVAKPAPAAVTPSNRSASNNERGTHTPGVATVNAADGFARTGRSSLLALTGQNQLPVVLAEPAWPLLPGSPIPQQRQQWQQQHPSPKESSRGRSQQHQQDFNQVLKQSSRQKQQLAQWNDRWQNSVDEHLKASCSQHKQQDSSQGITRSKSNAGPTVTPTLERAQTPTGKVSNVKKSAYDARDHANPLRSSWSEAYGASGGLRGKWPTSKAAGSATSRSTTSTSKVLEGLLTPGARPSRAAETVAMAGRKSLLRDQRSSQLASNGVLQELSRSASSPNAMKQAVNTARYQSSSVIAGPAANISGIAKQPQQQPSACASPSRPAGSSQQQQQQQPAKQGWGRSWLLQQTQLQSPSSSSSAAAAPSVDASTAQPLPAPSAVVPKLAAPDLQRQESTMSAQPGEVVQRAAIANAAVLSNQPQYQQAHMPQQPLELPDTTDIDDCAADETQAIDDSNKEECYSDSPEDFESDSNDSLPQEVPAGTAESADCSVEQVGPVDKSSMIDQLQEQIQQQIEHSSCQAEGVGSAVHDQQLEVSHQDPQAAEQQHSEVLADEQSEAAEQLLDEATEQREGNLSLQEPLPDYQLKESREQSSAQQLDWQETEVQLAEPADQQIALQQGSVEQPSPKAELQQVTAQPTDVPDAAGDDPYDDIEDEVLLAEQESLHLIAKAIRRTRDF